MAMLLLMMSANIYINISMHIGLYALLVIYFFSRCECGVPDRYPIRFFLFFISMFKVFWEICCIVGENSHDKFFCLVTFL